MNFDLIGLLISALKTAGKEPLVTLLQAIYDKNIKQYRAIVFVTDYLLSEGQLAATKTSTNIDDEVVAALQEIVAASATKNGITL